MPDPAPTPTPPPGPVLKKQKRSVINQADAADLNDTEQVVTAAQSTAYAAALATRGVTTAAVATLDTDVIQCRKDTAKAAQADFYAQKKTKLEAAAKTTLLDAFRYFQNAAKLKFPTDSDTQQQFFIGEDLAGASRPSLEAYCAGLIEKLATEPLTSKGVTAAEISAFPVKLEAWQDADTDQTNAQGAAADLRIDVSTLLTTIRARRTEIRLAVNLQWPHTDPANAPTRKAFGLPPAKPYNG
ncbi:MAG: hypothetical protein HZA92_10540 [Verrucomicrobia bacterium]|nr:hypothetical protein [Verrucomicrobiota bacterium]